MKPFQLLLHFIAWVVGPIIFFSIFGEEFFWFIALGSFVFLVIIYQAYGAWFKAPIAVVGLLFAIYIGQYYL